MLIELQWEASSRAAHDQVPPKVVYSLTDAGVALERARGARGEQRRDRTRSLRAAGSRR